MSFFVGVFNVFFMLFMMDLYFKFKLDVFEKILVCVGCIVIGVMVVIGLFWILVIQGSWGLYDYLQSVQGYLVLFIFVVFFFGIFNKCLNVKGVFFVFIVGFVLGFFCLAIDMLVMLIEGFVYEEGLIFWIINNIFFQYYSLFIFLVFVVIMLIVSYVLEVLDYSKISGLIFGIVIVEYKVEIKFSYMCGDVIILVLVVVLIFMVYIYFNG